MIFRFPKPLRLSPLPRTRPLGPESGTPLTRAATALVITILIAASAGSEAHAATQAPDPGQVKDHPLVSRFSGSKVSGYVQSDFDVIELPMGPLRSGSDGFEETRSAEGRITRIAYAGPDGKSSLEVYRNFRDALANAGFTIQFECARATCGNGFNAAHKLHDASPKLEGDSPTMINTLQATNNDVRILTARLDRPDALVDLSLLVSKDDSHPVGALLTIVEGKPMDQGQVSVDAKAMAAGLGSAGHIALYGIQFKTDSAALTSASDQTLAQMAALLQGKPDLKVYIVGHTDNAGGLAHNQALSQQRAEAVVKALASRHGVATTRMAAKGLASYAPVASNDSEDGRARNRRVELVAQ